MDKTQSGSGIFRLNDGDVAQFRADTDQRGDWYVWRRMSANGWATLRRCESREKAEELAQSLNEDPDAVLA